VEESTFLETCLPTSVPREAMSSSAAGRRPSSRALQRRRVVGALCSFTEDEGDGGEKFPRDLLACSSAGEAASSTPGRPRAAAACQRPSSRALRRRRLPEAGEFLLPLCSVVPQRGLHQVYGPAQDLDGFCDYLLRVVRWPLDGATTVQEAWTSLLRRNEYVRGSRSLHVSMFLDELMHLCSHACMHETCSLVVPVPHMPLLCFQVLQIFFPFIPYINLRCPSYSMYYSMHVALTYSVLGHRLDAKNFAKIFRFSVTSNL
jgi:hypothetical protein